MENTNLSLAEKEALIEQALSTQDGRTVLASSMANPIRTTLNNLGSKNPCICWKLPIGFGYLKGNNSEYRDNQQELVR